MLTRADAKHGDRGHHATSAETVLADYALRDASLQDVTGQR